MKPPERETIKDRWALTEQKAKDNLKCWATFKEITLKVQVDGGMGKTSSWLIWELAHDNGQKGTLDEGVDTR